ncbi:NAD(P)-dependent dehydrogenase (short-subunit alcohol dehydrogenase family) [Allocatelliglobosispora scoriae]|uniref:NAD(P)-dependent dehydrogenase (Short-subunit alcohol dehydrogenase family) n=1 Tax=Allocatelliglobosispora scoriae TaxID=643052 RepID=A0A841C6W2_9ACTN|nr:SDR family NAD(P)-dependent oxidoreductase [Allocatelliglobosispora scoriae]MBB5874521.1 NAD(P)-dependent dehydrogenase (short-subunit alcohol dehydrogenase family) [Allocatelliglobosispora scoriae]
MSHKRVIVVSGGTDGMGRALVLARAERGDQVVAIGSNADKGRALLARAAEIGAADRVEFLQADLSSVAGTHGVIDTVRGRWPVVDALALFANRQAPKRIVTADGLEATFALYYLSRYLLSHGLRAALDRAPAPVIVNVAGVGTTKGSIRWDDLQSADRYSMISAQLQAGRANDLLGVDFAAHSGSRARYVLYHPGFTRSGDLTPLPVVLRAVIRAAASISARPVAESVRPIVGWVDTPPDAPLTAIDRHKPVPLKTSTLDPGDAQRLATATKDILAWITA